MKKIHMRFIQLLVIFLCVNLLIVKGDFNLTVGTIYNYEVINSYWDKKVGDQSSSGTGFRYDQTKYPSTTQISTKVTSVNPMDVHYNLSIGMDTYEAYDSYLEIVGIDLLCQHPLLMARSTPDEWNQTREDLGIFLFNIFFTEPSTFGEQLDYISNDTAISTFFTYTEIVDSHIEGYFDDSTDIAVFDWVMNMHYINGSVNTNFQGEQYIKLAYNKNNGYLMGFKWSYNYYGNISGINCSLNWYHQIELVGYDLSEFYFVSPWVLSIEWFVIIPLVVIFGVFCKYKRKIKKV
ncbi:MAG: hypothetical protein FK734_05325 [Asgard group archaeon]|nr:hypothetical protein [Asgard group archaeon]